jgi:hypothetical protein
LESGIANERRTCEFRTGHRSLGSVLITRKQNNDNERDG